MKPKRNCLFWLYRFIKVNHHDTWFKAIPSDNNYYNAFTEVITAHLHLAVFSKCICRPVLAHWFGFTAHTELYGSSVSTRGAFISSEKPGEKSFCLSLLPVCSLEHRCRGAFPHGRLSLLFLKSQTDMTWSLFYQKTAPQLLPFVGVLTIREGNPVARLNSTRHL